MRDFPNHRDRAVVPLVLPDSDAGGPDRAEHLHHHVRDWHHRLAHDRPVDRAAKCSSNGRTTTRKPPEPLARRTGGSLFRHVLPNSLSPALVAAPFGIAGAIITEAGLSLLGFGVQPPAPSWGTLLRQGNGNYSYWWLVLIPSLAIFLLVTLFNLVGNGLRDAMDPRLRS